MDAEFISLQRALVDRYSLEREIGRGGMGTVYLARDLALERPVAIKALRAFAGKDESRERFLREARTVAKLQHPNIVPVYSVEQVDEWIIIVMAYIDGGTLGERVREHSVLPPQETARIIRDVALALAYAHRRGVVHRDVKPENVLLDRESGRAMVADFGIAHVASGAAITGPGLLLGTPNYMSPEQASGSSLDGRSDIYSLGVVMFHCLTGRLPFKGADSRAVLAQHLTQPAPAVSSLARGIPADLARVVARCLAKDAAARFQTGEDIAAELDSGQARRSEMPIALERWIDIPGELTLGQAVGAPLLLVGIWFALDFFLNPLFGGKAPLVFNPDIALGLGLVAPVPIYLFRRMHFLRRVLVSGYGIRDMREALRSWQNNGWNSRLRDGRWFDIPLRTTLLGMTTGLIAIVMFIMSRSNPNPLTWDDHTFFICLGVFTMGALGEGIYQLARKGRRLGEDVRRAFWNSRVGDWISRIAGVGLRGRQATPEFANRGTELALGSAAMVLYGALPTELRERFAELPRAIHWLEAIAQQQRARLEVFDRAGAVEEIATSVDDDDELRQRQESIVQEVQSARDRAGKLRRDAVAALQLFRLDLLRLHAQHDDLGSITADLEQALDLSRRLQYATDAKEQVDRIAEGTTPLPQVT
jgi:eukaryotic-like serine/threonine-protein kinase